MRSVLDALAAHGIFAEQITLDILATARAQSSDGLLWCDEEHVTLLVRGARGLEDLGVLRVNGDAPGEEWCRRVRAKLEATGLQATSAVCYGTAPRSSALGPARGLPPADPADSSRAGRKTPDIDLARDGLAGRTLATRLLTTWRRVAAIAFVVLLMMAGGADVHRRRVEAQSQTIATWERDLFASLFPAKPVPTGIALRLASEHRRLKRLTLTEAASPNALPDALATLRSLVATLPVDVRLDAQEIRIEGPDVTFRGILADHRQAERVAAALDGLDQFECSAPRTNRLPGGGVQFFLLVRQTPSVRAAPDRSSGDSKQAPGDQPKPGMFTEAGLEKGRS